MTCSEDATSSRGVSEWSYSGLNQSTYRMPERTGTTSGARLPFVVQPKKKPALALEYCCMMQLLHSIWGPLSLVSKACY